MAQPARWLLPDLKPGEIETLARALGSECPPPPCSTAVVFATRPRARRFLFPRWTICTIRSAARYGLRARPAHARHSQSREDSDLRRLRRGRHHLRRHLETAIELAGGMADFHVPHRLKDGYGMRPEVVEAAAARGVSTDHQRGYRHSRGGSGAARERTRGSTSSSPIITCRNPSCRPRWRYSIPTVTIAVIRRRTLCGVGVAFKLVQALLGRIGVAGRKLRSGRSSRS